MHEKRDLESFYWLSVFCFTLVNAKLNWMFTFQLNSMLVCQVNRGWTVELFVLFNGWPLRPLNRIYYQCKFTKFDLFSRLKIAFITFFLFFLFLFEASRWLWVMWWWFFEKLQHTYTSATFGMEININFHCFRFFKKQAICLEVSLKVCVLWK